MSKRWVLIMALAAWSLAVPAEMAGSSDRQVTIAWLAPGDDGNVGTAAAYDLRYSRSPITAQNWVFATTVPVVPQPEPAGTRQTTQIGGLRTDVTYYVALKTRDEANNWSELSNVVVIDPVVTDFSRREVR